MRHARLTLVAAAEGPRARATAPSSPSHSRLAQISASPQPILPSAIAPAPRAIG